MSLWNHGVFWLIAWWTFISAGVVFANPIRISGSDTLVVLNETWAGEYQTKVPDVPIRITGGGSELGFNDLLAGNAEIAAASRKIKSEELRKMTELFGEPPLEIPVSLDGVAIYIHNYNSVRRLTLEQLREIYAGQITSWDQVGGPHRRIVVFSRNSDSGTTTFFKDFVLKGKLMDARVIRLASTRAVAAMVSRHRYAVGFGGIAYAENARLVQLVSPETGKAVRPTSQSIESGEYPLSRTLYYYVHPQAAKSLEVKAFLDWVHSDEAQSIAESLFYVPLSSAFIDRISQDLQASR